MRKNSIEVVWKTDIGKARETNEDAYLVKEFVSNNRKYKLIAVADGLGGHKAGEVASKIAVDELEKEIQKLLPDIVNSKSREIITKIGISVGRINSYIYRLGKESSEYREMGTTLTFALIDEKISKIIIGHVGDSKAYLFKKGLQLISADHTYVEKLKSQDIITQEEAKKHPMRHVLTRAIGLHNNLKINFYVRRFDGILLLCTDGLSDALSNNEIENILLMNSADLKDGCEKLIDKANSNSGKDNVTVILAK